jgi:hypothetical protein
LTSCWDVGSIIVDDVVDDVAMQANIRSGVLVCSGVHCPLGSPLRIWPETLLRQAGRRSVGRQTMATIVEVNDEVHAHGHNGRFVVVSFRNSHGAVPRQPGSSTGKRRGFQISWIPETRRSRRNYPLCAGRAPRLTSGLLCLYLAALSRSRLQILPKYFFVCDAYAVAWRVL